MCVSIYISACMYVCMHVCMYIHMCVCVCVCVCLCVCVITQCTKKHRNGYVSLLERTHFRMLSFLLVLAFTHAHPYTKILCISVLVRENERSLLLLSRSVCRSLLTLENEKDRQRTPMQAHNHVRTPAPAHERARARGGALVRARAYLLTRSLARTQQPWSAAVPIRKQARTQALTHLAFGGMTQLDDGRIYGTYKQS
jgi:hypothetical protein